MSDDGNLAVWFTPDAIRDAFDLVGDDSEDEEVRRRAWVDSATDAQLRGIGEGCISSDALWSLFHELIEYEVDAAMATNQAKEEA